MYRQRTALLQFTRRLLASFFVLVLWGGAQAHAGDTVQDLEVFVRAGCPHCEAAKIFLSQLHRERPSLRIAIHDIAEDSATRQRLMTLTVERGLTTVGVPTFVIGTEVIVGFLSADTRGADIRARLDQQAQGTAAPLPVDGVSTRWFGELRVRDLGLPLFRLRIGLLDGFKPCLIWVLLFMLSLLVTLANRMKMLLIAGTLVAVEGLAYFAFMAAWLNLLLFIGISRITELVLGAVEVLAGAVNIKDFWAFERGISLSIPETAKPGLYERIRRILKAENMTAALL